MDLSKGRTGSLIKVSLLIDSKPNYVVVWPWVSPATYVTDIHSFNIKAIVMVATHVFKALTVQGSTRIGKGAVQSEGSTVLCKSAKGAGGDGSA